MAPRGASGGYATYITRLHPASRKSRAPEGNCATAHAEP